VHGRDRGTVGDIESCVPGGIRQLGVELAAATACSLHLTLVPIVGGPDSGEIKTKPTQHSVKNCAHRHPAGHTAVPLPHPLPEEQRRKIALFTNVEERAVISAVDSDDIYKIPLLLREQALDDIVVDKLGLSCRRRILPSGARSSPPSRIGWSGGYRDGRQVCAGARLLHLAQ